MNIMAKLRDALGLRRQASTSVAREDHTKQVLDDLKQLETEATELQSEWELGEGYEAVDQRLAKRKKAHDH